MRTILDVSHGDPTEVSVERHERGNAATDEYEVELSAGDFTRRTILQEHGADTLCRKLANALGYELRSARTADSKLERAAHLLADARDEIVGRGCSTFTEESAAAAVEQTRQLLGHLEEQRDRERDLD